jgi:hypothetical protein
MASYNSITFYPLAEDGTSWPAWEQEPNVNVRHIPYSDTDDIQFSGLGNFQVKVRAEVQGDTNMKTLRASVDGVARTLTDLRGYNFADTYLIKVENLRRWDGGEVWTCVLTFMKTSNVTNL